MKLYGEPTLTFTSNLLDGAELSSDDEEVEHYGDVGTSYNSYYRHVRKEMGEEGGESDDS